MADGLSSLTRHTSVWTCSVSTILSAVESISPWLSDSEQKRFDKFVFEEDRYSYAAGRILLKTVLSHCLTDISPTSWRILPDERGAIHIDPKQNLSGANINLSRRRDRVACIVGNRRVGIDIENISRDVDIEGIARTVFTDLESADMMKLSLTNRRLFFFERWCLKEAYVKALGVGFHLAPNRFRLVQGKGGRYFVEHLDVVGRIGPLFPNQFQFEISNPDDSHILVAAHEIHPSESVDFEIRDCSAVLF